MLLLRDIRKGDRFAEVDMGMIDYFVAVEDARRTETGWAVNARHETHGHVIEFFTADASPYTLNLYAC